MTGRIELHQANNGAYRIKLVDDLMNTLAISIDFLSEKAAREGVFTLREIVGTAYISDCTTAETAPEGTRTGT